MPVKGTKKLESVKGTTVVSTYVTGAPIAPADNELSIYVDLAVADQHRQLEVVNALKELKDRAREEDYRRPTGAVTCYYYVTPSPGRKLAITFTTVSTDIVESMVAIGIGAQVRNNNRGSLLLDACWQQIGEFMGEAGRLTA